MKCGKPYCACVGTCFAQHSPLPDKQEAALQAISSFAQDQDNWEQLENARLIIEKQARRIAELEDANASEVRVSRMHEIRIAELEAALDVALEALNLCLLHINYDPTGEVSVKAGAAIATIREVRK